MSDEQKKIDYNGVWEKALISLKKDVPPSTFDPWIKPLIPANYGDEKFKEGYFTLKSSGAFAVNHLTRNYIPVIEEAIFDILKEKIPVEVVFCLEDAKKSKKKQKPKDENLLLAEKQIENLKQMASFCALNLKYTFENFVVGENSKVAYNAAKLIADNPGLKYNPLFITGPVGMGKTHLMQAIGHQILKNFPSLKVKYTKTEEFTNTLVDALKSKDSTYAMKKFRDQYRNIDVLLMDDIQFAEGKKRTEEEIFNTYEALINLGKQIIFASERGYETFVNTPERLRTRYGSGLSVEIKPPPFETRIEIIKKYAKRSNYDISDSVAEFLAQNYSKNIRELEGAYNKVSAYASIQGIELTVQSAKDILGLNNVKKIKFEDIIDKIASDFNISSDAILGKDRSKNIQYARQISIYLTREILNLSYPALGKLFNRNHTTIMYACDKTEKDIKINLGLKDKINELKNLITE